MTIATSHSPIADPKARPLPLPLIDVAGLRSTDVHARQAVANQLRSACEQRGFFYIHNHGVDEALIAAVFEQNRQFFSQDMQTKQAVDKRHSTCNRGYEPLRAQTLEHGAQPDLKESFYIGREIPLDDPRVMAGRFNTGPNQWPRNMPAFREVMTHYYRAAYDLSAMLIRGLALSLQIPETFFDHYLHDASATLRLLHYPPQPAHPHPGEKGCGEHTDFGGITLLLQDSAGGLQVRDKQQQCWIDAPAVPGTYVVNIGDLFARWTNNRYVSTLHRVIHLSPGDRYSVPFFFTGNPLHKVECIPTCIADGELPTYPVVTVEEHQIECYRRTYG